MLVRKALHLVLPVLLFLAGLPDARGSFAKARIGEILWLPQTTADDRTGAQSDGNHAVANTGCDYVGNARWVQDARGYTTLTEYAELNRPIKVTEPPVLVFGEAAPRTPTVITSYDLNGNVLGKRNANGHSTVNTYDDCNRLASTTDAEGIEVDYSYDWVGNQVTVSDGLKQKTYFEYDGLKRVTKITDAGGIPQATLTTGSTEPGETMPMVRPPATVMIRAIAYRR